MTSWLTLPVSLSTFSFRFLIMIIFHYYLHNHFTLITQITEKLLTNMLNNDSIVVIIRHLFENSHDVLRHNINACGAKRSIYYLVSIHAFLFHGATARIRPGPPRYRGFIITLRHTTPGRTLLDEWSASCRDLYLTTHTTVTRDWHPCSGVYKSRYPTKRVAADPHLRKRSHWDRPGHA